jgi:hypothetical protein
MMIDTKYGIKQDLIQILTLHSPDFNIPHIRRRKPLYSHNMHNAGHKNMQYRKYDWHRWNGGLSDFKVNVT